MKAASKLRSTALQAVILITLTASTGAQAEAGPRDSRPDDAISRPNLRGLRSVTLGGQSAPTGAKRSTRNQPADRTNAASRLRGRILFHRYTNYDAWDGRLYLYDFGTKRLRCLSDRWEIDHAINANFSPDGRQIVFMGVPRGRHRGHA